MKNKEIEELLNELKGNADKHLENPLKYTKEYKDYVLLSYIKQLQTTANKCKQLEEEIAEYEFLIKMQNNREYRSKFLKEFQEEHGTNVFPDYDEIYKRYDKLKEENKQLEKEYNRSLDKLRNLRVENEQLKKQKDDVVEYIKNNKYKQYAGRNEFTCEIQYSDYVIKADDLLRMLGEID